MVSGAGDLSDADLVGQMLMSGFDGLTPTPDILDLIQRERVGGVILFSRNIASAEQALALTSALQRAARESGHAAPLLIGIDQENGDVRRLGPWATAFPGAMALAATNSEALAEEVAEASGRELAALGVNINFAPVADVNNNHANPVIGARSFGDDPAHVARFVAAQTRGYQRAGIAATLKHFPGHGDTATDSHLALPIIPHGRERLRDIEFPPFRAGIAAGAAAVMTAHIALPAISGSPALPATLAPEIIQGMLRDELGFPGVIMTDCLGMAAIAKTVGAPYAAVQTLRAGADIALISCHEDPKRAALAAVRQALADGSLSRAMLMPGAERVLALKRRFLSWEAVDRAASGASLAVVGAPAHRALAERAYERAVTLIRDDEGILPLRIAPGERLAIIAWMARAPNPAVDARYRPDIIVGALARHVPAADSILAVDAIADEGAAAQRASEADIVILLTRNASLDPAQAEVMRELAAHARAAGRRVIGVAAGAPYDAARLPGVGAWLAGYDATAPALEVAARALVGAITPTGRLPVALSR
ncbi:MAG TPA: glycoside hydrolase family 3 N-terminal domain-containing protein [Ktedonobacterales bacterium]|nr:glycoside hydrolase family 3 N-terminal domain-containing protein [Ktedonobacterales bacterium]